MAKEYGLRGIAVWVLGREGDIYPDEDTGLYTVEEVEESDCDEIEIDLRITGRIKLVYK